MQEGVILSPEAKEEKGRMKRLIALGMVLALLAVLAAPAAVGASQTVTITVGTSTLSASIAPTTWAAGAVTAGGSVSSFSSSSPGYFTLTNTGTLTESFTIVGADATGSTITWTLVTESPGTNQYTLGFGHAGGSAGSYTEGTYTNFGNADNVTLVSDLQVGGTYNFDLKLTIGTGTDVSQLMTTTVTITVVGE